MDGRERIRDSAKVASGLYAGPDALGATLILYLVACNYMGKIRYNRALGMLLSFLFFHSLPHPSRPNSYMGIIR